MTCIITGAVAFNGHAWVGGDLHQIGDCYVFNCVMHSSNGEPLWTSERESWRHYDKEVDFSKAPSYDFFERRGVLVATAGGIVLNEAAQAYLRKGQMSNEERAIFVDTEEERRSDLPSAGY